MVSKFKKSKRNRFSNVFERNSFRAPPSDPYSAFQPGGFSRIYHRFEAEKMKRSYDWIKSMFFDKNENEFIYNEMNQEDKSPVKSATIDEILKAESKGSYDELLKEIPIMNQSNDEKIVNTELREGNNKKIIFIDVKDLELQ